MEMTDLEKQKILKGATAKLYDKNAAPVKFELDLILVVALIGNLQLALRHPENTGPTRVMLDKFLRDLILRLDPERGDVYRFLIMGFDEAHDE